MPDDPQFDKKDFENVIGNHFLREQLGVSHAGWLDSSHDERALECPRWELRATAGLSRR
jgi:hypothetical protein